jgi:hypothetical protein
MGLHQIEKLLHSQGNSTVRRQPPEQRTIFVSYSSEGGIISSICKEIKKIKQPKDK